MEILQGAKNLNTVSSTLGIFSLLENLNLVPISRIFSGEQTSGTLLPIKFQEDRSRCPPTRSKKLIIGH